MPVPNAYETLKNSLERMGAELAVTRYALSLSGQDSATGWYSKLYSASAIHMLTIPFSPRIQMGKAGMISQSRLKGITSDTISTGDKIKLADGSYYVVTAIEEIMFGNGQICRNCELEESGIGGTSGYPGSGPDFANDWIYTGHNSPPAQVAKIDKDTLTTSQTLILGSGEDYARGGVVIGDKYYLALYTDPCKIARIDLPTFTADGILTLNSGEAYPSEDGLCANDAGTCLIVNLNYKFVKIDVATFSRLGSANHTTGCGAPGGICASGNNFYAGVYQAGGDSKVQEGIISPFSGSGSVPLSCPEAAWSLRFYNGYVYAGMNNAETPTLWKIGFTPPYYMTKIAELTMSGAVARVRTFNNYLYVGGVTGNNHLDKIDLSTFTLSGTLGIGSNVIGIRTYDNNLFALEYGGSRTCSRVDLGTFTVTGTGVVSPTNAMSMA